MKHKKLLSALLALAMTVNMLPLAAFADGTVNNAETPAEEVMTASNEESTYVWTDKYGNQLGELFMTTANGTSVSLVEVVDGDISMDNAIFLSADNASIDSRDIEIVEETWGSNGAPCLDINPDGVEPGRYTLTYVDEERGIDVSIPLNVEGLVTSGYDFVNVDTGKKSNTSTLS